MFSVFKAEHVSSMGPILKMEEEEEEGGGGGGQAV